MSSDPPSAAPGKNKLVLIINALKQLCKPAVYARVTTYVREMTQTKGESVSANKLVVAISKIVGGATFEAAKSSVLGAAQGLDHAEVGGEPNAKRAKMEPGGLGARVNHKGSTDVLTMTGVDLARETSLSLDYTGMRAHGTPHGAHGAQGSTPVAC